MSTARAQILYWMLLIFGLSVQLTALPSTIHFVYNRINIVPDTESNLYRSVAEQTLAPLQMLTQIKTAREQWERIEFADGLQYTPAEVNHLVDLKKIFDKVRLAAVVSLIALIYAYRKDPYQVVESFKTTLYWLGISVAGIVVFALTAWEQFFTTFHTIFFPKGNWSFPSDSLLITLFPEVFWQYVAVILLGWGGVVTLVIILVLKRSIQPTH